VYRVEGYGVYGTTGTPTLQFTLYWGGTGGTVLATMATAITLPATVTNAPFDYEATVTFRSTTSAVGKIKVSIDQSTTTDLANVYISVPSTATTVVTTGANALVLAVTWSAASTLNTISLLGGSVSRVA
jgi:hypothetical protein